MNNARLVEEGTGGKGCPRSSVHLLGLGWAGSTQSPTWRRHQQDGPGSAGERQLWDMSSTFLTTQLSRGVPTVPSAFRSLKEDVLGQAEKLPCPEDRPGTVGKE